MVVGITVGRFPITSSVDTKGRKEMKSLVQRKGNKVTSRRSNPSLHYLMLKKMAEAYL